MTIVKWRIWVANGIRRIQEIKQRM